MLVLTRKVGSSIIIDGQIKVQVVRIKGRQVRLAIEAPKHTKVYREEIQQSLASGVKTEDSSPRRPDCLSL